MQECIVSVKVGRGESLTVLEILLTAFKLERFLSSTVIVSLIINCCVQDNNAFLFINVKTNFSYVIAKHGITTKYKC